MAGRFEMADLKRLEAELLAAVSAAKDDAALEAVRIAALGKKGSVSELLRCSVR
jgi:phenylalanyl-tRNA synthetase alpha chain